METPRSTAGTNEQKIVGELCQLTHKAGGDRMGSKLRDFCEFRDIILDGFWIRTFLPKLERPEVWTECGFTKYCYRGGN